jgi:hypothetical protein
MYMYNRIFRRKKYSCPKPKLTSVELKKIIIWMTFERINIYQTNIYF